MDWKTCELCGQTVGRLALFCLQCGEKLPPSDDPADDKDRAMVQKVAEHLVGEGGLCSQSSHELQALFLNARFCVHCGTLIGEKTMQ